MDAVRQQEIFSAALEIADTAERSAMLDRACAGSPQLRAQMDELLAASSQAEGFFAECYKAIVESKEDLNALPPADGKPRPGSLKDAHDDLIGSQIGGYKLLQTIGEGGCGVVYMAEQEKPVRRRVALKVIKPGMDTKSVIARFEAEQQTLALMDHPNIAQVLDAGATETGRPYFVMELVRGVKVTDYCNERRFTTQRRLELFIDVCQAVQHAHQKGIIHRDLKPSNLLVTEQDGRA